MKWRQFKFAFVLGTVFFLVGCGDNPETQIYNHLEEAVNLEEGFEKQQDIITKLEQEEQDIYKQIIELGIDELEKITELAGLAISSIEERSDNILLEKESLDASREEFEKSKAFIDEIEEQAIKDKASEMYDTMSNRYKAYDTLFQVYNESLALEKELYEIFQSEDLQQEELQEHIEKVNLKYQEVIKANETFNNYTTEYNDLKKSFYDLAEINVKYVDKSEN